MSLRLIDCVTMYKDLKNPCNGGVALYSRVANNQKNLLEKQVLLLSQKAEEVGDCHYKIYKEQGSGTDNGRRKLNELLEDIKAGLYKRIYIQDISRISRDIVFVTNLFNELVSIGVEIVCVDKTHINPKKISHAINFLATELKSKKQ